MKKKLMMVAVLLGALSLGACVDDNESASVTDLRGAKAEQLRALAAYQNAQAEAEALIAAAEAQLRQAQAALEQAKASRIEEQIRQAQEEFNYQIAALQAMWEAKVAYWNSMKAQYENNLWANENTAIQTAYNRYSGALNKVYALNESILKEQIEKAKLQADQITATEAVNQAVAEWNRDLADEKRKLAKLQSIQEATPSMDEYLAMMDDLEAQAYDIANNKANTAKATENTKKKEFVEAYDDLKKGTSFAFVLAAMELDDIQSNTMFNGLSLTGFVTNEDVELAEDARDAYELKWGNVCEVATIGSKTYSFTFNNEYAVVPTTVELATLEMDNAFADALETAADNIELIKGELLDVEDMTSEPAYTANIGNKAYETVNGVKNYAAYYEAKIAEADKEIERLEKVIDGQEALGDDAKDQTLIDQSKEAIEDQEVLKAGGKLSDGSTISEDESYEGKLAQVKSLEIKAKANLNTFTAKQTEITELQKEYTAALAEFNKAENQKKYTDAIAALETPAKEYVEAQDAAEEFDVQLADLGFKYEENTTTQKWEVTETGEGSYGDIKDIVNGVANVQEKLDDCSATIKELEALIEAYTATGIEFVQSTSRVCYTDPITNQRLYIEVVSYNVNTEATENGVSIDSALALIDMKIAQITEQLNIQQALAEQYKEHLNTLLGMSEGETPETPDTPAEDETPAEEQPAA